MFLPIIYSALLDMIGLDPEMSNGDIWSLGIDWRDKYPSTRSFTFGLNVSF